MAYIIDDNCTKCGVCESECPVECITEGGEMYVIDQEACTSCGTCADVCAFDAPKES